MTPRVRQNLLDYGVALDGLILATGLGFLFPHPSVIVSAFFAATAVAVWKKKAGGVVSFALSILVLRFAFPSDSQMVVVSFYVLACVCMLFGPMVAASLSARRRDPSRVKARNERNERALAERKARARVRSERKAVEIKRVPTPPVPARKTLYTVNLITQRVKHNTPPVTVQKPLAGAARERKPRLLLVERRRATADTAVPKLSQRGVEVEVVERWVDAVDELFRFKPDALFIDSEHPEAELIRRTIVEQSPATPLIFTGSSTSAPSPLYPFRWLSRPYDPAELERVARDAIAHPAEALALH